MKVLLVYPEYPNTFWGFKYALRFISKRASLPPLGLLTVAAMLPKEWHKKLIDMAVTELYDDDIKWADYVFISAMTVQKESTNTVIERCKRFGTKVVAGGPLFTMEYREFEKDIDHLVLDEAEITLPAFLSDLDKGCPRHIYTSEQWADIRETPIPLWKLIDMRRYATMNIQFSRGCPFDCEFCDIPILYGHTPRTKSKEQMVAELEALFTGGWRGGVFIVDDNFIGNKRVLKRDILPTMIEWMEGKGYPFSFSTEASINLSDDEELMQMMVQAGFDTVFIGIESPHEESLEECGKIQNKNRDLISSVKKIQKHGLQVQGGFIIGFDSDPPSIFEKITSFIQESGIVSAMVGLLNAPRGTKLYQRLAREERLLKEASGNNTDLSINFIPKMPTEVLIDGYKRVVNTIYSPKYYYERVMAFLKDYEPLQKKSFHFQFSYLKALLKSMWSLGVIGKERAYFWKVFLWSLIRRPKVFPLAVTLSIYGFHFRKMFEEYRLGDA